jgi:hypothetical protein
MTAATVAYRCPVLSSPFAALYRRSAMFHARFAMVEETEEDVSTLVTTVAASVYVCV